MGYVDMWMSKCRECKCALTPDNAGAPEIVDEAMAIYRYCNICDWSRRNEA